MISISNVHFSYGRKCVFSGITTTLSAGHIYGVLGKNGTGKSTLLYNLAGLLYPDQGDIIIGGYKPSERKPEFLQDIFMIPEEFYVPNISIKALIKYYSPFYPRFDHHAFEEYISSFDIPIGNLLPGMSYGQKKKVYISFGLATNTTVLLMDEPTNGLDIISKAQLRRVVAGAATPEKTILISSHQVKDLENLIDEVLILDDTNIILNESIDRISQKLTFKITFDEQDLDHALYTEPVLKGNTVVLKNTNQEESKVDLELLYKATMTDPAKMKQVLSLTF